MRQWKNLELDTKVNDSKFSRQGRQEHGKESRGTVGVNCIYFNVRGQIGNVNGHRTWIDVGLRYYIHYRKMAQGGMDWIKD